MDIDFALGDIQAKLSRDWFLGGMKIITPNETIWIQHPLNPLTHFSFRLKQTWSKNISGQEVKVQKIRRLWIGGARPQSYRVFVGDDLVAEKVGC